MGAKGRDLQLLHTEPYVKLGTAPHQGPLPLSAHHSNSPQYRTTRRVSNSKRVWSHAFITVSWRMRS